MRMVTVTVAVIVCGFHDASLLNTADYLRTAFISAGVAMSPVLFAQAFRS